MIYYKTQ